MNWEALGTIAEIIGAIGVIASLLFLGFETRKSSKTMRASLSNEALGSVAALNDIILADPELRQAVSKATNADLAVSEFSDDEWDGIIYLGRALFLRFEAVYVLKNQGLIENDVWGRLKLIGAGMIQLPIWRRYWAQEQTNKVYSEGFIAELDSATGARFNTPVREDAA